MDRGGGAGERRMIALRADLKVVVASQPIDFRRGNPAIAVATQIADVQTINHQADEVHAWRL